MESYTVQQKTQDGEGALFYVLRMPENDQGTIILANQETGKMLVVRGIDAFVQNFDFFELIDESSDDDDEDEDDEIESSSATQSSAGQTAQMAQQPGMQQRPMGQ